MLGDIDRIRILGRLRQRLRVADGEPAYLRRGPQVRLEERRREPLSVRHVVEGAQVCVRGQPAARIDLEVEKIADHALVLGPVKPLEAPRAGVPVTGGLPVDHGLEGLDQGEQGVRGAAPLARRRHHPGAQLPDHLLRRRGTLVRARHVEFFQREVPAQQALVVTANTVALHDAGQVCRVADGRHADVRAVR